MWATRLVTPHPRQVHKHGWGVDDGHVFHVKRHGSLGFSRRMVTEIARVEPSGVRRWMSAWGDSRAYGGRVRQCC